MSMATWSLTFAALSRSADTASAAAVAIRARRDLFRVARGRFEGDESAHGVTDQPRLRRRRRPRSAARSSPPSRRWPQCGSPPNRHAREDRAPARRSRDGRTTRLQRPDGVIHAGAVQEDDGRQRRIEFAAAGRGEGRDAVQQTMRMAQALLRGAQRLRRDRR